MEYKANLCPHMQAVQSSKEPDRHTSAIKAKSCPDTTSLRMIDMSACLATSNSNAELKTAYLGRSA